MPQSPITHYAIVGAGTAGVTAAEAIREVDPSGEILLINGEQFPPYCRPLIVEVLKGERTFDQIHLRDADWYKEKKISLLNGDPATKLNTTEQTLELASGNTVRWDKLLVTPGSKPAFPRIDGLEDVPVFTLYRQEDVERLKPRCKPGAKAVLVGIGLIGLQAMSALREMGVDVVAVELQKKVLPLILDAKAAKYARQRIEESGVEVQLMTSIKKTWAANGLKHPYKALTSGGEEIMFDFLVVSTGMKPDFSLLEGTGIQTKRGIKVSGDMQTSVPNVYAAGDVTEYHDWTEGRSDVHGHWVNAYRQGRVAGLSMAGAKPVPYDPVYLNSLNIFGLPVITMGSSRVDRPKNAQVHVSDVPSRFAYTRMVLRDGKLVGATFVNDVNRAGVFQYLMREKVDIGDVVKSLFNREFLGMEFLYNHHEKAIRGDVEWPVSMDLIERYEKDQSHTRWGAKEKEQGNKK
ncbi:MAG: NAD(P)/FAD-dependent oxidoreductase [Candidatus Latescibacterota bacterium]|nr:MAG: NAD(P)/FAD-dependent oxidoreductase [Candidatus Latescibacterota bacterium]